MILAFVALHVFQAKGRPVKGVMLVGATQAQALELVTYLGLDYQVSYSNVPGHIHYLYTSNDSTPPIVVGASTKVLVPALPATTEGFDRFVPTLKASIARLGPHPFVLVPNAGAFSGAARDRVESYAIPLIRQAAREAGARAIEGADASFGEAVGEAIADPRIEKKDWKLVSTDSEQIDEGPARFAIDGLPDTYWHTQYSPTTPKYPHEIIVDMGKSQMIQGFRYTPRQDGGVNGRVKNYAFLVSDDPHVWTMPTTFGEFPNTAKPTRVRFAPVSGRYFRFIALTEQNGGPWASMAEIDVLRR